ncbi:hypothetical protein JTE90_023846 [Oedothorax gibbosus]|uniref:Uncharacterized protein n=1 Tax=Oedothorax gibbosus TaxID=931172 RepID=A0AAV6VKT3_9ARAC|nr:hypothetical protein JTE90_023846 [Oedothorax gibbosus]
MSSIIKFLDKTTLDILKKTSKAVLDIFNSKFYKHHPMQYLADPFFHLKWNCITSHPNRISSYGSYQKRPSKNGPSFFLQGKSRLSIKYRWPRPPRPKLRPF